MLFTAYPDEQLIINQIHEIRNEDYALLRLTPTMIEKNNLDANSIFRDLLYSMGIADYNEIEHGGANGIVSDAFFIQSNGTSSVKLKFYRVSNNRGDRRFSIETIKRKMHNGEMNEGDLLYFSAFKNANGLDKIFIINLTSNTPTKEQIINAIGFDEITEKFNEIKPLLQEILSGGWYDNSKGAGSKASKDVGDTLESLLSVETNNRNDADIDGLIEIKSKGIGRTLDTLFTLRPCFEGTPIASVEPNDRSRVSAFTRKYGYESEKHPKHNSLYITIGSENAPQNNQGFYLEVDDDHNVVNLIHINQESQIHEITAYWNFQDLKKQLYDKHPSTLWISADERMNGDILQFKYNSIEFSRSPQFMTFLSLIKAGKITYDWRGYTTKLGTYSGKNHGNAWRIKPNAKSALFGEISIISFD
ncbi:MvaI/BcnI family restriction endonuclease [Acetoanaerobium sticklandii]|uniref:MvaI/BcnI family restriction endonuclease n=1 Tax=Acetoanaerobium sticklandii TaxID=1511 RepID=UPI003A90E4BE